MLRALRRAVHWVLCAFIALSAFGCAQTVEDINRVQPNYVKKSALEGHWYYRQTVVEVPAHVHWMFEGIEGPLEKIRWEVRETSLIGYRVHPTIDGLEDDEIHEGADYIGEPVVAFPITSHFDIIRQFDSATGQQNNVLVEDTSLRPWYERDYIRVSWHTQSLELPGNLDLGITAQLYGIALSSGQQVRPHESEDPDHLRVEEDFIFSTVRTWVTSPYCGLFYDDGSYYTNPCGGADVSVRFAFSKIDEEEAAQFQARRYMDTPHLKDENGEHVHYATISVGPEKDMMVDVECTPELLEELAPALTMADCKRLEWDDAGRFGFFRTYRTSYDRQVGAGHDHNRNHMANHHQMWRRTIDNSGEEIPIAQRELRPIIYYLNTAYPDDLKNVATRIGTHWNEAFMGAAIAATGRTAEEIGDQLQRDYEASIASGASPGVFLESDELGPRALFQVRENSCSRDGILAYLERNPAMRIHLGEAGRGRGILTGNKERICASLGWHSRQDASVENFEWEQMGDLRKSFVWWVNEAQPNGPLGYGPSSADMQTGQLISGNAHVYGAAVDSYARSAVDIVRAINGDLDFADIIDGHSYLRWVERGSTVADAPAMPTPEMQAEISRKIGSPFMNGYRGFRDDNGNFDKAGMFRHMHDRIKHTHANDPMAAAMNSTVSDGMARFEALREDPDFRARIVTDEMLKVVGPLFGWRPGDDVSEEMEELAFDMAIDPGALGKRHAERTKFFADHNVYMAEAMDDSIAGLALEMQGLDPEEIYRRLREEIFEGVMLHEIGHTVGMRHNFKGSFDALNYQEEFWRIRNEVPEEDWDAARLPENRYSTIMEYGGRFNSDFKGLGKYDRAAIKYLYGHSAEVFTDDVNVPGRLDLELELNDYSKIPEILGGLDKLHSREDRPIGEMRAERMAGVRENTRLYLQDADRAAADYWTDSTVPYYFCADFENGDFKCRTWDEGSNHTEVVQSAIQNYWNYYVFNSYRRGRSSSSFVNGYFGRQARLSTYLTYPWKYYYFYDAYPVDVRDDLLQASLLGLNFINQVMGTPEPGQYCRYSENLYLPADVFNRQTQQSCSLFEVPIGPGRDPYISFNEDYNYKIDYIGSFYDKSNLMFSLVDPSTYFMRLTDESDRRQYRINYYQVFKDELVQLVRDMMMGALVNWSYVDGQTQFFENSLYGQRVVGGELRPQLLVDPERFNTSERATPAAGPQIYTRIPYNIATNGLLYNAVLNSSRWDNEIDFAEYLVVRELGSGDDRVMEGVDEVVFVHPMTGQSYAATQTIDGKSIAYELLEMANGYVTTDWEPARQAIEADPDNENFQIEFERRDRQLYDFVEMMDFLRELRAWADWGQYP